MQQWNEIRGSSELFGTAEKGQLKDKLQQAQKVAQAKYADSLKAVLSPALDYVDAFLTNAFNTLNVEEIEEYLYQGETSPKLAEVLKIDYTQSEAFKGKSFVTGHLLLRDVGPAQSAVQAFNRAILSSGITKDFMKHARYVKQHSAKN